MSIGEVYGLIALAILVVVLFFLALRILFGEDKNA
jgi:hypothetical protein